MRAFVTGASGFIGGVLTRRLLADGHEVHALVRRPRSEPPGAVAVSGDLNDGQLLRHALEEVRPNCVFHLAAEIASQRSERKLRAVNVDGTERLLDACLAIAGADPSNGPRVVFASTVVTGDARGQLLDEQTSLPVQTAYGRSKQEAERLTLGCGLPVVVVRPSHVYGPGGWYESELIARLRSPGRFAVVGDGKNLWDVVHVHDVVSALMLAAGSAEPGSTYHAADDEPIGFYDFMALTARELGLGAPRRIPAAVARIVAGAGPVQAAMRSARSSNAKIKRELGWRPLYPNAGQGVPAAVRELALR